MRSILPKIFLASAMVATAALATNNALAETMVNVPFSFTVNGKVCPAGRYAVDRNPMSDAVMLRTDDWKRSFSWIASPGYPAPSDSRIILRFDRDGDSYKLQSVQYRNLITSRLDGQKGNEERPTRIVVGQ
jgi:hypothetical protein